MPPLFLGLPWQPKPPPEDDDISEQELQALLERLNTNDRELLAAILAPKRVIRDARGRVAGVETI